MATSREKQVCHPLSAFSHGPPTQLWLLLSGCVPPLAFPLGGTPPLPPTSTAGSARGQANGASGSPTGSTRTRGSRRRKHTRSTPSKPWRIGQRCCAAFMGCKPVGLRQAPTPLAPRQRRARQAKPATQEGDMAGSAHQLQLQLHLCRHRAEPPRCSCQQPQRLHAAQTAPPKRSSCQLLLPRAGGQLLLPIT